MRRESAITAVSLVLGIGLILVLFVLNLARTAQSDSQIPLGQRLPLRLAGLPRLHVMEGEEAAAALAELHGTSVGTAWAGMAHYGEGAMQATVWVGEADTEASAQKLLAQMTEGIQRGGTQFSGLQALTRNGQAVFMVRGMGQVHYYFAAAKAIVWVSADLSSSDTVLAAVLQAIGQGERR